MSRKNIERYYLLNKKLGLQFDAFIREEITSRPDASTRMFLYEKFFKKKLGTAHQRVTQVFIAAQLFGIDTKKHHDELMRLAAVPELLIWSEYAFNWVTDGKNNDTGTKFEDNLNLITSQYLLTEVVHFLPERMLKRYLELYRWGIYGCLVVERDLRITNWGAMCDREVFWKTYSDNHCIPDVGALYAYCFEIVSDYFQITLDKQTSEALFRFGCEFGRGVQINGDLSDFMIPNELLCTTEKRPEKDYFIDIRTNRLTYPSWLLLDYAESNEPGLFAELIKSADSRAYPDDQFYYKVYECMKRQDFVEVILKYLADEKQRLATVMQALPLNDEGKELWLGSIEILEHNKFQRQIENDYCIKK